MEASSSGSWSAFKRAEKRYKLQKSNPTGTDFSDVIDFDTVQVEGHPLVQRVGLQHPAADGGPVRLNPDAQAFTVKGGATCVCMLRLTGAVAGYEGFVFIRAALDIDAQCELAGGLPLPRVPAHLHARHLPGRALLEWVEGSDNSNLHAHHPHRQLGCWLEDRHGLLARLRRHLAMHHTLCGLPLRPF